ncbi:hypothetical protein A3B56_00960 [Candidatus Roizmanbacteria bacterium RIFCSPLOWO2_01_FULL_45_11]|uniref:Glycosyltransferase 2-like domain-containing protein n=1 Tax=Candidatus Roizmanbacteria bacterium RIFCSPLOWO2_01_FULL_45_11 TaxID=1802070 RepID=A0A1F7JIC6_9BACT|nr:MAG: hypothetical protein A3B56_00960 [Candidatus Roizmanbacteria bacterium RIFCSPLOWO2_01_FULL_45_11]
MVSRPKLSVVLPCYNEVNNIKKGVLNSIYSYLSLQPFTWEVCIVDDGSTDDSGNLIQTFIKKHQGFTLIENKHLGKAKAVTRGVLEARGEIVLFSDFDQATPLSEIKTLMPYFPAYDIVIGSRKDQRKGAPFSRRVMAKGFMMLRNVLLGLGVEDTQCGFKTFKREQARLLFKKLRLYRDRRYVSGSSVTAGFDVELLYVARKLGYSIKEVPVVWKYVETRRVSAIRDSWEGLRDLVRIKVNDIRGVYE